MEREFETKGCVWQRSLLIETSENRVNARVNGLMASLLSQMTLHSWDHHIQDPALSSENAETLRCWYNHRGPLEGGITLVNIATVSGWVCSSLALSIKYSWLATFLVLDKSAFPHPIYSRYAQYFSEK